MTELELKRDKELFEAALAVEDLNYSLANFSFKDAWRAYNWDLNREGKPLVSREEFGETERCKELEKNLNACEAEVAELLEKYPELSSQEWAEKRDLIFMYGERGKYPGPGWFEEFKAIEARDQEATRLRIEELRMQRASRQDEDLLAWLLDEETI